MRAARILQRGRARANSLMTEKVRIGIESRGTDPETGKAVLALTDVVYGGDPAGAPGMIKYPGSTTSDSQATGQPVVEQKLMLKLPTGSPLAPEGTVVIVVSSEADALLAGRRYRIDGAPESGSTTAHRYPLVELT